MRSDKMSLFIQRKFETSLPRPIIMRACDEAAYYFVVFLPGSRQANVHATSILVTDINNELLGD